MRLATKAAVVLLPLLLLVAPHALALDAVTISYPGPAIFFLPTEIARRQGFFRDQNLDAKLILTKSDADRAALASGDVDYTLRDRPQQVQRFLKASLQAHRFMREQRETTLAVLMNWIKADRETAEGIYQLSIDNFTRDGTVEESLLKSVIDQQLAESKVPLVPLSQLADFSLLQQVLKEER